MPPAAEAVRHAHQILPRASFEQVFSAYVFLTRDVFISVQVRMHCDALFALHPRCWTTEELGSFEKNENEDFEDETSEMMQQKTKSQTL